MITRVPKVIDSVIFGKMVGYPMSYQTTSKAQLAAEGMVHLGTINVIAEGN